MLTSLGRFLPTALRERWHQIHSRVSRLEKRLQDTEHLLELLLTDAEYDVEERVGLNGQDGRRSVVRALLDSLDLSLAVETGTNIGRTAGYLATEFKIDVISSELVPKYYGTAKRYLRNVPNVVLRNCDSRKLLQELAANTTYRSRGTFFYLDAHWYEDLPLEEELQIIASNWERFVVLVDDFRVPGDSGYGYDDYGPGKSLEMSYLRPILSSHPLGVFFPVLSSAAETGAKRGYVVLSSPSLTDGVRKVDLLREEPHR